MSLRINCMSDRNSLKLVTVCLGALLAFSGCSRYQYVILGSRLPQNEKQEYILENDSVQVKYSCSGQNFPLKVTIFNKLQQPIYIDLQRTTVIINDVQSNAPDLFEGQSDFIAPQAFVSITSVPLFDTLFQRKTLLYGGIKPHTTTVGNVWSFTEETSPLFIRIILALSPYEDHSSPTFFDYSFWASDIIENSTGPKEMTFKPANQFYVSKSTGFGKTLGWTGAAALLVVGSLLGLTSDEEY